MLYVATEIPPGATSPRFTLVNGYYVISHTSTLAAALAVHARPFFLGEWGYEEVRVIRELPERGGEENVPANRDGKLVYPDQLVYDHGTDTWCLAPLSWMPASWVPDIPGGMRGAARRYLDLPEGASRVWGSGFGRHCVPRPQAIPAMLASVTVGPAKKKVNDPRARKVRIRKGE